MLVDFSLVSGHRVMSVTWELWVMTSIASLLMHQAGSTTTFQPPRKKVTQLLHVEKLKAQILRCLNLTAEPEPPTKKPPESFTKTHNRLPVPQKHTPHRPPAFVWSEPVDTKKKMADRLLFRVSNQRKRSSVINRVTLLLRLRFNQHSRLKHRGKSRPARRNRNKLPDYKDKGVQNDGLKRGHGRKRLRSRERKKKSRRKRSRRVKILVQTMNPRSGRFKRVAVQRVIVDKKFRWIKLPIPASLVSSAAQSSNQSLILRVRCKRCYKGGVSIDNALPRKKTRVQDDGTSTYLSLNPYRPYLVISIADTPLPTQGVPSLVRSARHVHNLCSNQAGCCAERVYVSFKDLGWDHWIVHPEGFSTVQCRGVCHDSLHGVTSKEQRESSFAQKLSADQQRLAPIEQLSFIGKRLKDMASVALNTRIKHEASSCQPQGQSALAVTLLTEGSTLVHRVIPDLISDRCVCMRDP